MHKRWIVFVRVWFSLCVRVCVWGVCACVCVREREWLRERVWDRQSCEIEIWSWKRSWIHIAFLLHLWLDTFFCNSDDKHTFSLSLSLSIYHSLFLFWHWLENQSKFKFNLQRPPFRTKLRTRKKEIKLKIFYFFQQSRVRTKTLRRNLFFSLLNVSSKFSFVWNNSFQT